MLFELFQFMPDHLSADAFLVLESTHSHALVILSYLVAVAASYSALDLASHASHLTERRVSMVWRCVGAFCLGGGIWSMHFIGMLAFEAPIPIHFDLSTTLASLLIAILASLMAMWVIGRARMQLQLYAWSACIIGLGIAAMHYVGMAAVRSLAQSYYDPLMFGLSVLVAIGASFVALLLTFYFHNKVGGSYVWSKVLAALVMGVAVVAMHLTGMAGYTLVVPAGTELTLEHDSSHAWLGFSIAAVMLVVIGSGMAGSRAERMRRGSEEALAVLSKRLDEVAHYDALTGLYTKPVLGRMFETLVDGLTHAKILGLLYLDVDNFKRINDSLGYGEADRVLAVVADRLRSAASANDILGRFSGDEFCILTCVDRVEDLEAYAVRIQERMHRPISIGEQHFQLSLSLGLCAYKAHGDSFDELVANAVLTLSHVKRQGMGRFGFYQSGLREVAQQQLRIEQELRHAIAADELRVHYQPIMDTASGRVTKLEALVRWQHPTMGFMPPDKFIPVAEATGLVTELDLWVLRRACRDLAQLNDAGLQVAFNCSAVNLSLKRFPHLVQKILEESGVAPHHLILEVTENALMSSLTVAAETLNRIRALGICVSVDDFGSGYSSLAYLSRLPLDTLKVDRLFVRDIPSSQSDMAITAAIIAMAHKLNLKVVAEGVETQAQEEFLRQNQCDYLQGYLFSKPLPLDELQQLLQTLNRQAQAGGDNLPLTG